MTPRLQVGGTLDPRKHVYISRQDVEEEIFNLLAQGEYCNIMASRQVGKSSLMKKTALRLINQGIRIVDMDIAGELGSPKDMAVWYVGFLNKVARDLGLKVNVKDWWEQQRHGTLNQRLLQFFREEVASAASSPVVVFVDEIDSTLRLRYTDDFFTAIRTMYNDRVSVPEFEKIAFCLIGVATPNELIKDRRTTPYNIGHTFELRDFDIEEDDLTSLIQAISNNPDQGYKMVRSVLKWTDGQPYLTILLCDKIQKEHINSPEELNRFVNDAFTSFDIVKSDAHFERIDSFLNTRVLNQFAAFKLYERILQGKKERDETTSMHIQLKLSGLVKRSEEGYLIVRNHIYKRIFNSNWVRKSELIRLFPSEETRKTQKPSRYLVRSVAGLLALFIVIVSWWGINRFIIEPGHAARNWLSILNATSDEIRAQEVFKILTGQQEDPNLRRQIKGFERQAIKAYKKFWNRRSKKLLKLALERIENGKVDQGLILGALAALKNSEALNDRISETYKSRQYELLQVTLRSYKSFVGYVEFSPDGKKIVTKGMGGDTVARIWDTKSGKELLQLSGHASEVSSASFAPDGKSVVTGSHDRTIRIWDSNTGKELRVLEGHKAEVNCAAFSPDGKLIVSGSNDGTARIWETETGEQLLILKLQPGSHVYNVVFSAKGKRLLLVTGEAMNIWDMETEDLLTIEGDTYYAAFSPDGTKIVRGQEESKYLVQVYDSKSAKELATMQGHSGSVPVVGFFPHKKRIFSASHDNTFRIWDTETGDGFFTIAVPYPTEAGLRFAALSPDGKRVATAQAGGVIRIWDLSPIIEEDVPVVPLMELTPQESWKRWQHKLGLTVTNNDEVMPLRHKGPSQLNGWDPKLVEQFGKRE